MLCDYAVVSANPPHVDEGGAVGSPLPPLVTVPCYLFQF